MLFPLFTSLSLNTAAYLFSPENDGSRDFIFVKLDRLLSIFTELTNNDFPAKFMRIEISCEEETIPNFGSLTQTIFKALFSFTPWRIGRSIVS